MVSKRATLFVEGNPSKSNVRIKLEITFDRILQYEDIGTLPINPELYEHLGELCENYRLLVQQNSRSFTYLDENVELHQDIEMYHEAKPDTIRDVFRIKPASIKRIKRTSTSDCDQSQAKLRETFLNWLETSEDCRRFNRQARDLLHKNEDFEFVIRYDDSEVERLPWYEWDLFSDREKSEPTFSPILKGLQSVPQLDATHDRVKILVILGNSAGINLQEDRDCFERLRVEANAEITFLSEPNREDVNDALWEEGWSIICFSGHSSSQEEEGKIYLNPKGDYLSIDDLWYGLRKALKKGLCLTIFNSCDGLKIARRVNDQSIPYAIVMRESITDVVAHKFLRYFLKNFTSGKSLQASVREARERLHDEQKRNVPCTSWLPIILQAPSAKLLYWNDLYRSNEPELTSPMPEMPKISESAVMMPLASNTSNILAFSKRLFSIQTLVVAVLILVSLKPASNVSAELGDIIFSAFANTSLKEKAHTTSRSLFKLAILLNPLNSKAYLFLGNSYEDLGGKRVYDAIDTLEKSHEMGNFIACSNLGRLYILEGRMGEARTKLESCEDVAEEENSDAMRSYYKNKGWLFYALGNLSESEKNLNKALEINPEYGEASCFLAQVLEENKVPQEATKHHLNCIQNSSNYLEEIAELQEKSNKALNK